MDQMHGRQHDDDGAQQKHRRGREHAGHQVLAWALFLPDQESGDHKCRQENGRGQQELWIVQQRWHLFANVFNDMKRKFAAVDRVGGSHYERPRILKKVSMSGHIR